MTPKEALDLLSVAARATTWQGADPKLARELYAVVHRLTLTVANKSMDLWEVERLRAEVAVLRSALDGTRE
jgi:hypothetical protein